MAVGERRMRIVAGAYRGRRIQPPPGQTTRPTTDRVREALFSSLVSLAGPDLGGGRVLDAFAGSGALGLEALSRGCESVTFVEKDRKALEALRYNIASLRVDDAVLVRPGDAFSLVKRGALAGPYSLILLDPPYTLDPATTRDLLAQLAANGAVEDGAIVTWERSSEREVGWPQGFEPLPAKRYGSTTVEFATYQRGTLGQ